MIFLLGCVVLAADDPAGQCDACAAEACTQEAGADIDNTGLRVVREPGETEGADGPRPCKHYRWYRERVADGKRQLILDVCNDGYGASGVGEDSISVDGPRFSHSRYGGSAWRWDETRSLDLRTWMIHLDESNYFHVAGAGGQWIRADYDAQQITAAWGRPSCGPDGEPKLDDDAIIGGGADFPNHFLPIPVTTAVPKDWRSVRLGTCAARSDAATGIVPYGGTSDAKDAAISVAMTDSRTLIVEWKDDQPATPKGPDDWVGDDHLEIWVTPDVLTPKDAPYPSSWLGGAVPFEGCADSGEKPIQWGIRVSDGKVFAGHGASKQLPTVELAKDNRARIVLPWAPTQVSVLYSDADGPSGQERLVGTSDLRYGKRDSIGFAGLQTPCGEEKDSLHLKLPVVTPTSPTTAVLVDR